jgi:hypothetical protein
VSAAPPEALTVLRDVESRLDPAEPERTPGLSVVAYGEVSACLRLTGLPGLVCKRMSGFADVAAAACYEELVRTYLSELADAGIGVVSTDVVRVARPGHAPVVYLLQPQLDAASLGHALLVGSDDAVVTEVLERVLAATLRLAVANSARSDGVEIALDGQLSNWSFGTDPERLADPVLLDVGTPFMRRGGRHLVDIGWLETPIPPVVRTYYHRRALVGAYLDDYYDPRLVAVDLLGNFHKEGRPDRVPLGVDVVNRWLAGDAAVLGPRDPVTAEEVEKYYRSDADLLALYLRLRRTDRFLRTKVFRRPYDFVLPGHVSR